jgi:hypothetical protein
MSAIGGYFELELGKGEEYHKHAIRLNTARNAFEYLLIVNQYVKVYLPYFTCDVLLEPLQRLNIAYEFYNIDLKFEPLFDYGIVQSDEVFLYTNYFGLKDVFIKKITAKFKRIIIDNAQSFFSKPIPGIDTFYSPRKFFGVPDGAYLYSTKKIETALKKDISFDRSSHLLKRLDCSAEIGYQNFIVNDKSLKNQPILEMSNLTRGLLNSIDYNLIRNQRKANFYFLHEELKNNNKLEFEINDDQVPMVYPFWSDNPDLKGLLHENQIYCATYWSNVMEWVGKLTIEYSLVEKCIYLPIDQRIKKNDLKRIIKIING